MKSDDIVAAGGVAPVGSSLSEPERSDALSARAYSHPALRDSLIVTLTPETLAPGTDLEMEFLGFAKPESVETVGLTKRRALGFPGWALVHDPKHAGYALEVVKEFKKEARRARSKPGHAKEGIDAIAKTLGKTVPHFLPTFYEEAARAFIDAGASSYAAQCFGKARDAERVHALEVDEERRREAFVEFALAGAITTKSITTYAKDLQKEYDPDEAYAHIVELATRRTLGGMPPWASMGKDLRRLLKATTLDLNTEEERFLREIITAPALKKAPQQFWKSYEKPLRRIAKSDAAIRGALLALMPSFDRCEAYQDWLLLLESCGALDALWDADAPEDAKVPSRAKWASRWIANVVSGWRNRIIPAKTGEILTKMAPLLASEKEPILLGEHWRGVPVDICELCLSLDIPVTMKDEFRLSFGDWAEYAEEPGYGCDPVHIAADPRFAKAIDESVQSLTGSEPFESVARGKAALKEARERYLQGKIDALASGTLPSLTETIGYLRKTVTSEIFAELPQLFPALAKADFAGSLARTLRSGTFDEVGWDAFDEACDELDPDCKGLHIHGAFPYLVVTNNAKAIVLGPKGRLLEHDLRVPNGQEPVALRYCQEQLFVMYRQHSDQRGYWSANPSDVFDVELSWGFPAMGERACELADGGITEGKGAYYAGDRKGPESATMSSDGENFWRSQWGSSGREMREFNPKTDANGRLSMPSFIAEYTRDGMAIDVMRSWVLPLPSGVSSSILGSRDGLVGLRVRERDWASPLKDSVPHSELESISGHSLVCPTYRNDVEAFLSLPGASKPNPLAYNSGYNSLGTVKLLDAEGTETVAEASPSSRAYAQGTHTVLPPIWWNLFAFRSESDSAILRKFPDARARKLIDLAASQIRDGGHADEAALRAELSDIESERIAKGITGITILSAQAQLGFADYAASVDPANASKRVPTVSIPDDSVKDVLASFLERCWGSGNIGARIGQITATLAIENKPAGKLYQHADSSIAWLKIAQHAPLLAVLATGEGTPEEAREPLLDLLSALASLLGSIEHDFRILRTEVDDSFDEFFEKMVGDDWDDSGVFRWNGNDYVREEGWFLEVANSGSFHALDGVAIAETISLGHTPAQLEALAALAKEKGPIPWDPAIAETLAERTGLSTVETSLFWLGMPNLDAWDTNWVPKPLRERLGLKVAQCTAAKATLSEIPEPDRRMILAAAASGSDAAALWNPLGEGPNDESSPVARVAAAWVARFGKRVALDEEVVMAASKEIGARINPSELLGAIVLGAESPLLSEVPAWSFATDGGSRGERFAPAKTKKVFTSDILLAMAEYIPWVFHALPVGHEIRNALPGAYAALLASLSNEDLVFSLSSEYLEDEKKSEKELLEEFFRRMGGEALPKPHYGRDTGTVIAFQDWGSQVRSYFRPAKAQTPEERSSLETTAALFESWSLTAEKATRLVRSEGYAAMVARCENTPVPEGQYEANPLHAAPELVKEVGTHFDVGEDAALLYLQVLTLPGPTTKALRRWNGWSAAKLKKAAAELTKRELLLEAKRARAGRTIFLPGGWEAYSAPHLPVESWKLALHPEVGNTSHNALPRHHMIAPTHELFAAAWKRVQDGDAPRYEEV